MGYDRGAARDFFIGLSLSERRRAERLATSGRRLTDPDEARLTKSFLHWSLASGATKRARLDPLISVLVDLSLVVVSVLARQYILTAAFVCLIPIALWSDHRRKDRRRRYLRTGARWSCRASAAARRDP